MKVDALVVGLVSALTFLSCAGGATAHQGEFWHRLRRGLGKAAVALGSEYEPANGPALVEDSYITSYPYGYNPPADTTAASITVAESLSATGESDYS